MKGLLFWIWLSLRCRPGSGTFDLLNRAFSSPYDVYEAEESELRAALTRYDADLARLCDKSTEQAEKILKFCTEAGVDIVPFDDARYPVPLREIASPPVLLYVKGTLPNFSERVSVTVVGTRKISDYGKRMAFEIARDLSRAGVLVVSGMALGIDGVANAAAINGGGETVAVLGSGIDVIYPAAHTKLFEAITRHGAVITEFAPGTRPEGRNFPIRNRILSGLGLATAVIEADLHSGALITARRARQQNRPVYALPGRVDEPGSEGTCMLLREGAKLLTCADDILTDFNTVYADKINIFRLLQRSPLLIDAVLRSMRVSMRPGRSKAPDEPKEKPKLTPPPKEPAALPTAEQTARLQKTLATLSEEAAKIYAALPQDGGMSYDELVEEGFLITKLLTAAVELELSGLVTVAGGILRRAPLS